MGSRGGRKYPRVYDMLYFGEEDIGVFLEKVTGDSLSQGLSLVDSHSTRLVTAVPHAQKSEG